MHTWFRSLLMSGLTVTMLTGFAVDATWAGSQQVITLRDASIVRGEILEMKNGQYRIKSPTLGELTVPLDQVVSIVAVDAAGQPSLSSSVPAADMPMRGTRDKSITIREGRSMMPPSSNAQTGRSPTAAKPALVSVPSTTSSTPTGDDARSRQEQVNTRVQSMMMNEEFFDKVINMGQSSEMEAVMNDPEIMNAIQNLDYEYLMNNPKMKQLMESQAVKSLLSGGAGE